MKSAWGSDDPTKAAFPFSHGLALAEAGHEVQIFLLGEAVVLMRKVVAEAVTPAGWPKVAETLNKLAARHIPIYACGACIGRPRLQYFCSVKRCSAPQPVVDIEEAMHYLWVIQVVPDEASEEPLICNRRRVPRPSRGCPGKSRLQARDKRQAPEPLG